MDYTQLTAALKAYLQTDETTFNANIANFVTQAEDRIYKAVIMPANRKGTNLTLTLGDPTINLPNDFLFPFELRVNDSGEFTPVGYVDVSYIRESFPNPLMIGIPRWYSMYDSDTIIVAPTPSAGTDDVGLTAWLNYFYKPPSITTASESWLGDNAQNVLLYACLAEAYTFLKGDPDLMKLYEDKFQVALKDLKTLGEGLDLGDAYRMGERRVPR